MPGKTIILEVIALNLPEVESAEQVAGHLRRALEHTPGEQLVAAPDCGMKYLSRDVAFAELQAMVTRAPQATTEDQRCAAD